MHTQLCDLFGIDVPIFAFSHCRDVVAAVTNAGGLGVLGALAFSPEQLEIELQWIDENVDGKPYGVDTVMPMKYEGKDRGLGQADEKSGEVDAKVFQDLVPEPVTSWIESVLEEYEVPPLPEGFEHDAGVGGGGTGLLGWTEGGGRNHVDIALQHPGVKLLVNALGPPPKDIIDLAHDHGIKVAALTGAVEHAIRQQQQGVDIIVAQGTEAGGHTGEIGSMVLLPDIVDAVSPTPVLGAGGIASGRQAAAAMALGASGDLDRLRLARRSRERRVTAGEGEALPRAPQGRRPLALAVGQAGPPAAHGLDRRLGARRLPGHAPDAPAVHGVCGSPDAHHGSPPASRTPRPESSSACRWDRSSVA